MALPAPWFVFVLWALFATLTLSCAAMLWLHRERLGFALATAGLGWSFGAGAFVLAHMFHHGDLP